MIPASLPLAPTPVNSVQATVHVLNLSPGIHAFTIVGGAEAASTGQFPLPSVQFAPAPGNAAGTAVEMLGSRADHWLASNGDTLVIRVGPKPADVVLTTYKPAAQPQLNLSIQMVRLDNQAAAVPGSRQQPGEAAVQRMLRAELLVHVQNRGDIRYTDAAWAGAIGQRLWIEAFSIQPLEELRPDEIEYKAVTANGWETPWTTGGTLCGTRGMNTAIVGLAIRLRGAAAERYDCVYESAFVSGHRVGPHLNGAPARSDVINDPLEGFFLRILEKGPGQRLLPRA